MPLFLGENYKIESDELNVTVYKKSDTTSVRSERMRKMHEAKGRVLTGKQTWGVKGYYSTIKSALHGIIDQEIRDTNLKDIQTVINKIDELHSLIDNLKIPDVITKRKDGRGRPHKQTEDSTDK